MKKNWKRVLSVMLVVVMLSVLAVPFSTVGQAAVLGDLDQNGKLNVDDAVHLLFAVNFPASYSIPQAADFNDDGSVDADDAICLLFHLLFPERYELIVPSFTLSAGFARHVVNPPVGTGLGGYSTATPVSAMKSWMTSVCPALPSTTAMKRSFCSTLMC